MKDISEQKKNVKVKTELVNELYFELNNWRKSVNAREMKINPGQWLTTNLTKRKEIK